jgi:hypothetical protein
MPTSITLAPASAEITLTYRTEAEAKAAREQIKVATAGVIDTSIA